MKRQDFGKFLIRFNFKKNRYDRRGQTVRSKWQTPSGELTTFFDTGNTLSINRKHPTFTKKGD